MAEHNGDSNRSKKGPPPNNKGPIIVIGVVGSIVVVAIILGVMLFRGVASHEPRTLDYDNTHPPGEGAPQELQPGAPRGAPQIQPTTPPKTTEDEAPEPTDEEFWKQAHEAAVELNDGKEPTHCESPCDCPQGQQCQQGSQLCIPGPFPVYCCDKDGCPDGQACRHRDGTFGTCEADDNE